MREFALELRKSRFFHFFGGSGGFPGGPDLEIGVSGSGTRFRGSGTRFRGPEPEFRGPEPEIRVRDEKPDTYTCFRQKSKILIKTSLENATFSLFQNLHLAKTTDFEVPGPEFGVRNRGPGTRFRGPESGSRDSKSEHFFRPRNRGLGNGQNLRSKK